MNRAAAVLALALVLPAAARAQGIASPGPLSAAHARIDDLTKCLSCHEAGRELSGRRCLACHVSLAARLRADSGFHADATRHGANLNCGGCHSEHNGRPYKLVRWEGGGQDAFDHARTGFRLVGAHARQHCADCHKATMISVASVRADTSLNPSHTFLGLGTTCASCHLDEHRGRVSRQCDNCHEQTDWKPATKFDHAKTHFALEGRHANVPCSGCHTVRRDAATGPGATRDTSFLDFRTALTGVRAGASQCAACHRSPHADRARMARCEACHNVQGWFALADSIRRFDHAPTGFPLRGAHARAACEHCHLASAGAPLPDSVTLVRANFLARFARPARRMAFARCDDCHDSPHAGQLSATRAWDCARCHDEVAFAPASFGPAEHDSTRFALTGAHRAVPCARCHEPLPRDGTPGGGRVAFRRADISCMACHGDPHGGQFAPRTCDACHATAAWDSVAGFDHDQTRYPLRGRHRAIACGRCHKPDAPGGPVRFAGLPTSCEAAACHGDPHRGQFADRARGSACVTCHSEDGWKPPRFDHQSDSDWPLDGAHRALACTACHHADAAGVVRFRPLPHRCLDCHPSGQGSR